MINKQLGLKLSAISLAVFLASCGGGGGGGYYGDDQDNANNDSTIDTSKIAESVSIDLQDTTGSIIQQANDGSIVQIAVQVLNKDKGGVSGKPVRLSISDAEKLGVTSKASLITTGADGFAIFEIIIPNIAAHSGKVQLTATVDGTTIKQSYTLNIAKKSVIQSEYNLSIQQGLVLNLPKGSVSFNAQVTDKNGGIKAGKNVILSLPADMQDKFLITSGSSVTTDSLGNAKFTIQAKSDLTSNQISELIGKSQTLNFKLIDENQAVKEMTASITFKDISQVVQTLGLIKPDAPMIAQGGETTIRVFAKNSNGDLLAGKTINLAFSDTSDAYGVTIVEKSAVTDRQGYATFTLKSASSYPIALSQAGISLKATFVDSADIFAVTKIDVITADNTANDQLAIQRLEIASSYKINAKDDQVVIRVKGINNKGEAATKGKVKLTLNAEATSNGVTFDGNAEQEFLNGYVVFTLNTNAKTSAAVEALVKSGITAIFTTDNGITNNIKIAVESEEKSEESVHYLAIDPINAAFDYTKDQTIEIKTKAIGVNGSALIGEKITLAYVHPYTVTELQALGLTLTGQSTKLTDATGYATFKYQYKASGTNTQKALVENGVKILASSASGTPQSLSLNFKAPTEQGEIDLDYLNVDMLGSLVLTSGIEQTVKVSIKATGTDGKLLPGQKVGIGLSSAAISNGVSLTTASALSTDANGNAIFSLKVKANNTAELANLIANGITVAVSGVRKDNSIYSVTRKIEVTEPTIVLPSLAGLNLSYDVQTVSVLGGEVRVKVTAKDNAGKIIANTPVAIALSSLVGERVSLSDSALTTNSKGEAEFTIQVAEGIYDANLIKNGITFAVVGTSLSNGDRIQQTGTIQVAIPQDAYSVRLSADHKDLAIGKEYQIKVAVKDELGANTGGYPVLLSLNSEAINAGVKLNTDSIVTAANTVAPITITLPKTMSASEKQALIASGIIVNGKIKNPKGEDITTTLSFNVIELINPNHLTILSSKDNLSVDGDRSIVTVALLDSNNQPVRNQSVTLAANNAATLIIGTPGSGHPTNTSTPQTVITDSNGHAFFSVELDENTIDDDLLIASGIELTATHTDTNGSPTTQIYRLSAYKPLPATQAQPEPARYSVRVAVAKPRLNVRNDTADVTVTLVDGNGGGVADQYVKLAIADFINNGAIIVGASGLTTDTNGQAVFKVKVDETSRKANYSAVDFANDDLRLTATFSELGYLDATQITSVDVVQAVIQNPVASIVIGVNSTGVTSSSDNVYYSRNLSVSVTDFDGKPLANQEVVMDMTPLSYVKGRYNWELVTDALGNESLEWVYRATTVCPITNPNAISNTEVTNIPVKVPTFLGYAGTTAKYTTDAEGKFDFTIRYPKIYAQWLDIQVGASSTVASLPNRTTYNVGLASASSDYSTDGTYGPNLISPYGTLGNCP